MVPEAELEQTDAGLVPASIGWFVMNARDARWFDRGEQGHSVPLTGYDEYEAETFFPMLGMAIRVLADQEERPGHAETIHHVEVLRREVIGPVVERQRNASVSGLRSGDDGAEELHVAGTREAPQPLEGRDNDENRDGDDEELARGFSSGFLARLLLRELSCSSWSRRWRSQPTAPRSRPHRRHRPARRRNIVYRRAACSRRSRTVRRWRERCRSSRCRRCRSSSARTGRTTRCSGCSSRRSRGTRTSRRPPGASSSGRTRRRRASTSSPSTSSSTRASGTSRSTALRSRTRTSPSRARPSPSTCPSRRSSPRTC